MYIYKKVLFFIVVKGPVVGSAVLIGVVRYVNIHIRIGELFILIALISVPLRSGAFRWSSQAQFGQFGLLLFQTLFAPLDASVLKPDFDLWGKKKRKKTLRNRTFTLRRLSC